MNAAFTDVLDEIVKGWSHGPSCEMATHTGAQCQRPATWRLNLHGCEYALICGRHCDEWTRGQAANMLAGSSPRCAHCGQVFTSLADAFTVGAL